MKKSIRFFLFVAIMAVVVSLETMFSGKEVFLNFLSRVLDRKIETLIFLDFMFGAAGISVTIVLLLLYWMGRNNMYVRFGIYILTLLFVAVSVLNEYSLLKGWKTVIFEIKPLTHEWALYFLYTPAIIISLLAFVYAVYSHFTTQKELKYLNTNLSDIEKQNLGLELDIERQKYVITKLDADVQWYAAYYQVAQPELEKAKLLMELVETRQREEQLRILLSEAKPDATVKSPKLSEIASVEQSQKPKQGVKDKLFDVELEPAQAPPPPPTQKAVDDLTDTPEEKAFFDSKPTTESEDEPRNWIDEAEKKQTGEFPQ